MSQPIPFSAATPTTNDTTPIVSTPLATVHPQHSSPTISQIPTYGSPSTNTTALSHSPAADSLSTSPLPRNATTPTPTTPIAIENLTENQKAIILRKHLLTAEDQRTAVAELQLQSTGNSPRPGLSTFGGRRSDNSTTTLPQETGFVHEEEATYPIPYDLPGADVTAEIYKWAAKQEDPLPGLRRSKSLISIDRTTARRTSRGEYTEPNTMSNTVGESSNNGEEDEMRVREMREPGGFRRDFVIRKMTSGNTSQNPSGISNYSGAQQQQYHQNNNGGRFTRSFIDFLSLYGHFGGEDLEEIEEDEEDEEEDEEEEIEYEENFIPRYVPQPGGVELNFASSPRTTPSTLLPTERSTLVRRTTGKSTKRVEDRRSASRRRSGSVGDHGDATITQAVLMLLKSFVGTGVLFLGKAFYNGGMIFSIVVLMFIAMISLYSFLLLVRTRLVVHGSFGDIGGILYGKYMRWMILFSIVLSQIGFVAAYTIFVAQNLQAFVMAVTNCRTLLALPLLIFVQVVVFLPLAMIRNIQKLSGTALVADAFILFGLVYIFGNEIKVLAEEGLADIQLFNSNDFPLLIGTAVFAFEGIGLVIPITESMKDPHQFPRVLTGVMMGIMVLFAGAGVLSYAAYGSAIQTVVFVNLPQSDRFVNASQLLYSLAILLSTPLQLFPAVRIMENGLFSRSGKYSDKVKWEKNVFRAFVVFASTGIAWVGANDLDKFVSLIGSVACVPLCFCYPALLHYKACAMTRKQKVADIALFVFGLLAMVYTTSQTIKLLSSGAPSPPPVFGNCPT